MIASHKFTATDIAAKTLLLVTIWMDRSDGLFDFISAGSDERSKQGDFRPPTEEGASGTARVPSTPGLQYLRHRKAALTFYGVTHNTSEYNLMEPVGVALATSSIPRSACLYLPSLRDERDPLWLFPSSIQEYDESVGLRLG